MTSVGELAQRAKAVAPVLATASTSQKNAALLAAADCLGSERDAVLAANEMDLEVGRKAGIADTVLDRLRLDSKRVEAMAAGMRMVADLADPVGRVIDGWTTSNGLRITQVRVPLGVIGIIYENRPNVTSDAAALCVKSGNVAFLRGSSGAINSNIAIADALRNGIEVAGLPRDTVILVQDTSRDSAVEFMRQRDAIDCLIPRGGPGLIESIRQHATVPFIIDGDGNCHVYIDRSADIEMALRVLQNAKTQRPGVCNAAESLLVHEDVAAAILPRLPQALPGVELVGDEASRRLLPAIGIATEDDFAKEFLDLKMSVAIVADVDAAIERIARYGTGHSEAIMAEDVRTIDRFTLRVDAAAVVVNASTRFVDGEQFGFGAEIGISTQKLHARGPLGLTQLTTGKYIVRGEGQVRN